MIFSIIYSTLFCLLVLISFMKDKKNLPELNYKNYVISAIIIFFSIFIRSYKITEIPTPLNFDESSIGYEAFSILNYGIDRNGKSLPIHFIGWGSGQNVPYAYLLIPIIKILGNNIFSLRLLMLIISSLSIIIAFYLFKDIFKDKYIYALFIFTVMPWHIMKSRWALDCNIFPDIILFIIYLYNKFFKTNNIKLIYIISVILGLSTYVYGTSYIFVPTFLILNLIYLIKHKYISIKQAALSFLTTTIISIPMLCFTIINYFDLKEIKVFNITIPRLYFNRFEDVTVISDKNIFLSLLTNFKDNFLLLMQADDYRLLNMIPGYGTLYYISIPFVFIGLYYLFKLKTEIKIYNIIINNLICASIIMCFVTKSVHRINVVWYPIIITVILGILEFVKEKKYVRAVSALYLVMFLLFTNNYFNKYNESLKKINSEGYYQCLKYIKNKNFKYNELIITDTINLPYITYLYVFEINPKEYLKTRKIEKVNVEFQNITRINNVKFKEPSELEKDNVYILTKYKTEYLNIDKKNKKCFSDLCVVINEESS